MNKSLISKIILVASGVLSLIFLAVPFAVELSGFNWLSLMGDAFKVDFAIALICLSVLVILLASIVLAISSVLTLLGEFKFVKSEKILNIAKKINFIVSIVLCSAVVLPFILLLVKGYSLGIGCILILVLAGAGLVASVLDRK